MTELRENERIDSLQRKGYAVIQNSKQFCFGIDAVLLSWFAEVRPGEEVMDLCSGSGVIPILMEARYSCGQYSGLEIREDMTDMAARSAKMNGLTEKLRFFCGDVKEASKIFGRAAFDVVTVNPPYMAAGSGIVNPDPALAAARHELFCTLEDVLREAAAILKPGGRFYMVHRPERLPGILEKMRAYGLSPKTLKLVYPQEGKDAVLLLVSGTRGKKELLKILPPLTVYASDGGYTEEVKRIYHE